MIGIDVLVSALWLPVLISLSSFVIGFIVQDQARARIMYWVSGTAFVVSVAVLVLVNQPILQASRDIEATQTALAFQATDASDTPPPPTTTPSAIFTPTTTSRPIPSVTISPTITLTPSLTESPTIENLETSCFGTISPNTNVRNHPGTGTTPLASFVVSKNIEITGQTAGSDKWFKGNIVESDRELNGVWVSATYVRLEADCGSIPIISITIINSPTRTPESVIVVLTETPKGGSSGEDPPRNTPGPGQQPTSVPPTNVPEAAYGSMDIGTYCGNGLGFARAIFVNESDPHSWVCEDNGGNRQSVNFSAACRWFSDHGYYSQPLPYPSLVDPNNGWTWRCGNRP